MVRDGPQAMRNQLLEWGRQKPLQWAPRGILSHSYKVDVNTIIPTYNEVVIFPRNQEQHVKVKGIFINNAEEEIAGEVPTYEASTDFIEPMRQMAKELDLPVIEFETNNGIQFQMDDSRFKVGSIDEKFLYKNTNMWVE